MMRKYFWGVLMLVTLMLASYRVRAAGQAAVQVTDPEIKTRLDTTLPRLKNNDSKDRETAIRGLHEGLMTAEHTRDIFLQTEGRKSFHKS